MILKLTEISLFPYFLTDQTVNKILVLLSRGRGTGWGQVVLLVLSKGFGFSFVRKPFVGDFRQNFSKIFTFLAAEISLIFSQHQNNEVFLELKISYFGRFFFRDQIQADSFVLSNDLAESLPPKIQLVSRS